jgi:hypothetical protein
MNFRLGTHQLTGMAVSTLGAGGCCVAVPARLMGDLPADRVLEELELDHKDLPRTRVRARVAYASGRDPVTLGLEFLEAPVAFMEILDRHVEELLAGQGPRAGY